MSETDETPETTETPSTEETDKDRNFRKMEEQIAERDAELAELRPLQQEKALLKAGFDPDSDRGVALGFAIKAGEVEPTSEAISEFASSRGWDPKPVLTETEAAQVASAAQVKRIQTASVPDAPSNIDDQIAELQQAGKHAEAFSLTTRSAAEKMLSGVTPKK
ncbi:hypothetical protein LCGC14_2449620, partial [marine sediment metagenome]